MLLFPVCVVVSAATLLNAASTALVTARPAAAIKVNPLNSNARVGFAYEGLRDESQPVDPAIRPVLERGIGLSPLDARLFTQLGIVEERSGDIAKAQQLYDHALSLLPTEFYALIHQLNLALKSRDYKAAVDRVEIIARRWGYWPSIDKVLPVVLSDGAAFADIAKRFSKEERLRNMLIGALANSNDGLPIANSLLRLWHREKIANLEPLINLVTAKLAASGDYGAAFQLFEQTRPSKSARSQNFVYNGDFAMPFSGNVFDWRVSRQAGVEIDMARTENAGIDYGLSGTPTQSAAAQKALAIRFLNTPVRFRNITQMMTLPPGNYRVTVKYSARQLKTPKPLRFAISCMGAGTGLATVEFAKYGTFGTRTAAQDFSVPGDACPAQQIFMFGETLPDSWKYRYEGTFYLESVRISVQGD